MSLRWLETKKESSLFKGNGDDLWCTLSRTTQGDVDYMYVPTDRGVTCILPLSISPTFGISTARDQACMYIHEASTFVVFHD